MKMVAKEKTAREPEPQLGPILFVGTPEHSSASAIGNSGKSGGSIPSEGALFAVFRSKL